MRHANAYPAHKLTQPCLVRVRARTNIADAAKQRTRFHPFSPDHVEALHRSRSVTPTISVDDE
jgi:hypothetical protein